MTTKLKINYKKMAFAILLVCSGWLLTKIYLNTSRTKNPLVTLLDNQERTLWQQLEQNGVSRTEFELKKKNELNIREKRPVTHAVSEDVATILTQTAHDFDLNPDEFSFDYMTDPSEAATDADTIFINQTLFNKLPKAASKFVLGHEMQHLKFNDSIERVVLQDMLEATEQKKQSLLDDYIRFQETRADINAAIKNEEYAQSYQAFMNYVIKLDNTLENPAYPTDKERLQLAQQTVDYVTHNNSGATA